MPNQTMSIMPGLAEQNGRHFEIKHTFEYILNQTTYLHKNQ